MQGVRGRVRTSNWPGIILLLMKGFIESGSNGAGHTPGDCGPTRLQVWAGPDRTRQHYLGTYALGGPLACDHIFGTRDEKKKYSSRPLLQLFLIGGHDEASERSILNVRNSTTLGVNYNLSRWGGLQCVPSLCPENRLKRCRKSGLLTSAPFLDVRNAP